MFDAKNAKNYTATPHKFPTGCKVASITKHKQGWRVQVYVKGERDSAVRRTRREAEIWGAARETELRALAAAPVGERHTFGDAMRRYLKDVSSTKRGQRWEELRIEAFLRDPRLRCGEPVGRLTTAHLSDWRDARLDEVSAGTVLREIGLLADLLEVARREWQWIVVNPMRDMRKPKAPDHRKVLIDRWQIKAMLRAMGYSPRKELARASQSVAACFLLALRSGMRAGELTGLTWDRVHDGYCVLRQTKTVPRDVPLTDKAMRLIMRMRGYDRERVFGLSAASLDTLFRRYRNRAGLGGFTFHDARHTAATWIVRSGKVDVLTLCKIMGWSNPEMAMVYYNPKAADIARVMSGRG